jgi:PKD repeat protein
LSPVRSQALPWLVVLLTNLGCEKLPAAPDLPNEIPIASFSYTPVAPIYAGETPVAFSALGSHDNDGQIVSYIWNFGDGTPEQTTVDPTMRHTFPDTLARCLNVTYGVMLVVVDDKGGRGVATQSVTVTELPAPNAPECVGH